MPVNSFQKGSLTENTYSFIRRKHLARSGETLVVGVSGGPDSVCLLHVLVLLMERLEVNLHIAHLDHLLRGEESEGDARYVAQLAKQLGVDVTLDQRDVEGYRSKHRMSLEEASRYVRYQFFADVAKSLGTDRIVLGHNANDQMETILLHLLRGTGAYGLQGMQSMIQLESMADIRLTIVRPLLEISREDIEVYCRQHDLHPRRDSSNLSSSHMRNRIRNELIPLLRQYNPGIDKALLRTADTLAIDASFFKSHISLIWDNIVREDEGSIALSSEKMNSLHPALQRYLLREVTGKLLGSLKDIEWKHIEKMVAAFNMKPGKKLVLPRGLILYVRNGECRLTMT